MRLYFSRTEQYVVVVLLLVLLGGLLALSYAYGYKRNTATAEVPVFQPQQPPLTAPASPPPARTLVVHVAGAVVHPGLYHLPPGTRVEDALTAAGGAAPGGYPDALNRAAVLADGEKITVPTRAEWLGIVKRQGMPPLIQGGPPAPAVRHATGSATAAPPLAAGPKPLPTGKVSLNTATAAELMTLPGVGPVTARHILDYRQAHGKFTDLAELLDVPKIGPKTYERLAPYVTL